MKKKTITLTGFMGKDSFDAFIEKPLGQFGVYRVPTLAMERGSKCEWMDEEWPPVRVSVEIAVIGDDENE